MCIACLFIFSTMLPARKRCCNQQKEITRILNDFQLCTCIKLLALTKQAISTSFMYVHHIYTAKAIVYVLELCARKHDKVLKIVCNRSKIINHRNKQKRANKMRK